MESHWQKVNIIKKVVNRSRSVSKYFRRSGNRTQKLKDISKDSIGIHTPLQCPPYFAVRWTEYIYQLLHVILHNWKGSMKYFQDEDESAFEDCWLNFDLIHCTSFLADLLREYKSFQKFCESDKATIPEVIKKKHELSEKFQQMKEQPLKDGWEEQFLKNVVDEDEEEKFFFSNLLNHTGSPTKDRFNWSNRQRVLIIETLLECLTEKLVEDVDLTEKFISLLNMDVNFPQEILKRSYDEIIPDLCETQFYSEYNMVATQLNGFKTDCPLKMLKKINETCKGNYITLKTALARLAAAKPHSCDVERLISVYNKFKDSDRASMGPKVLWNYIYINVNMGNLEHFDSTPATKLWISLKERRHRPAPKAKKQAWFKGVFDDADLDEAPKPKLRKIQF